MNQQLSGYGGTLKNPYQLLSKNRKLYKNSLTELPRIYLTTRQLCDLELLLNGAFSPLEGFLNQDDYESVLSTMRLTNGVMWPIPIVLDAAENVYNKNEKVLLCNEYGKAYAVLVVESIYSPDKEKEAEAVYGANSLDHFGVKYLYRSVGRYYLGGKVFAIEKITHSDFSTLRHTPEELRNWFAKNNWKRIIGFQTRNPIHKAHFTLIKTAAEQNQAKVLIHPSVGMTKDGDINYPTRVACYKIIQKNYAPDFTKVSLLQLAMRMAGPREALLHAIIRKNYGCTDFIVGRAHADPGVDSLGNSFYDPYEAQKLAQKYADEIGITILPFQEMAYHEKKKTFVFGSTSEKNIKTISGTQMRKMLRENQKIPEWFSFPEVIRILKKDARKKRGLTIFLTGLPCSGKSTIAGALANRLEKKKKIVSVLDGDKMRKKFGSDLGFSRQDRETNIRRIGYVAAEITKHGGIAICAVLAPYQSLRDEIREMILPYGQFMEVYVSTPLEVCRKRDVKGLYKKAEQGILTNLTGVNDVYEIPHNPEIALDTSDLSIHKSVGIIMRYLEGKIN